MNSSGQNPTCIAPDYPLPLSRAAVSRLRSAGCQVVVLNRKKRKAVIEVRKSSTSPLQAFNNLLIKKAM